MSPCLTAYQPNLVARQFGLCQIAPKSFYPSHELLIDVLDDRSWEVVRENIDTLWARRAKLTFTSFKPVFFYTQEFRTRWQSYLITFVNDAAGKMNELTVAFNTFQGKTKKCKAVHIK